MVLHDVAQRPGLLVELAAPLDPDRLGDGDLDMVDILAIPERLEDAIAEAEDEQVLHRLLAEVVIDAIDLGLGEGAGDLVVQRLRRGQVVAERLLDHQARPAGGVRLARHLALGQPGILQVVDDHRVVARRGGQGEDAVSAGAALLLQVFERLAQAHIPLGIVEVAVDVAEARGEALPPGVVDLVPERARDCAFHLGAEPLVVPVAPRIADDRERGGQGGVDRQVVELRHQLAVGQIAGHAEDHHRTRRRRLLQPQPLAQGVHRRPTGGSHGRVSCHRFAPVTSAAC